MELLLLDHVEVEKVMIVAKPNITETCYIVANISFPICITMYAQAVLKKEPHFWGIILLQFEESFKIYFNI